MQTYQNLRCLITGITVVYGIFSHNEYRFTPENPVIPVDTRDIPDLLSKKMVEGGCCGKPRYETQIFEIVE